MEVWDNTCRVAGAVVPIFKKSGITLLSLPGKVYSRMLVIRLQPIVEP